MFSFSLIAAVDSQNGIGKNGRLPWHLPSDLRHFKELTTRTRHPKKKNMVIMGRRTWESIPEKFRPLPGRINVVLTRQKGLRFPAGVQRAASLGGACQLAGAKKFQGIVESLFVIGGEEVFKAALGDPRCEKIFLTRIHGRFDCDVFFPKVPPRFRIISKSQRKKEGGMEYQCVTYQRTAG